MVANRNLQKPRQALRAAHPEARHARHDAVTAGRVLARGTVFTAAEEIERASGHAGLEGDCFLD
jgi:hypothetical protein